MTDPAPPPPPEPTPNPPAPAPSPPPAPAPSPAGERATHGDKTQRWGVWVAAGAALIAAASGIYTAVLAGDAAEDSEVREQRREAYTAFLQAERQASIEEINFFAAASSHQDGSEAQLEEVTGSSRAFIDALTELEDTVADVELAGSQRSIISARVVVVAYQQIQTEAGKRLLFELPIPREQITIEESPMLYEELRGQVQDYRDDFLEQARTELGTAD